MSNKISFKEKYILSDNKWVLVVLGIFAAIILIMAITDSQGDSGWQHLAAFWFLVFLVDLIAVFVQVYRANK